MYIQYTCNNVFAFLKNQKHYFSYCIKKKQSDHYFQAFNYIADNSNKEI